MTRSSARSRSTITARTRFRSSPNTWPRTANGWCGRTANTRAASASSRSDMDIALFGQYVINGLMLGVMYGLVAVGFTLFFGVLDVIKFSHGDVLTVGAFTAFATYLALKAQMLSPWLQLIAISLVAMTAMALLGAIIAKYLVLPLRTAPALNTLLITLMLGTVLREGVRLI